MKGTLGGLYNGENQVGGFLDWELDVLLADSLDGESRGFKFSKWILTAKSYWTFDDMDEVVVRLYNTANRKYWEGEGCVLSTIPNIRDTMIHSPLKIVGEKQLVEK